MWFGGAGKVATRRAFAFMWMARPTPRLTWNCTSATASALATNLRRGASPASAKRAAAPTSMTLTGFRLAKASASPASSAGRHGQSAVLVDHSRHGESAGGTGRGAPAGQRAVALYKLENYTAQPLEEFALCDVKGDGALYQVTMAAKGLRKLAGSSRRWKDLSFMEACMRAYIGGAKEPLFLSSGLEDYFLGTYYFNKGRYATPVAGLTHFDANENEFSAYRFHEDDPVFFQNGLRLTCRCGEKIGGRSFRIRRRPATPLTSGFTSGEPSFAPCQLPGAASERLPS